MSTINEFHNFNFSKPILRAIDDLGYETATPVQEQSIPILLEGCDLVAQAQTGTGKTAAFALPILERLNIKLRKPQALVLAPTRELAIQVAEAFQSYAKHLTGFHVVPIYGGQSYTTQLSALKRGVHVVVGTPGRVMDHMRRGTLVLADVQTLVLDEADEMLNMGFLDDVKWILEHMPQEHQTALFSATIPPKIKQVASKHLQDPQHVKIKTKTMTAPQIVQSAMIVSSKNKLEALTRYLEIEDFDGIIVFARTKNMTTELAEKLAARGYFVTALNGDMNQRAREQAILKVKKKKLDIIVATDVAARGLDVERLSHVINYDVPYDAETYVHRIGRTGRAGREGKSLLLLTPREQYHLRNIERMTKQEVTVISPPTIKELSETRTQALSSKLLRILEKSKLDNYREVVEKMAHELESSELDIAAALLKIVQKDKPLQISGKDRPLLDEKMLADGGSGKPRKRRRSYSDGEPRRRSSEGSPRKRSSGERSERNSDGPRKKHSDGSFKKRSEGYSTKKKSAKKSNAKPAARKGKPKHGSK